MRLSGGADACLRAVRSVWNASIPVTGYEPQTLADDLEGVP